MRWLARLLPQSMEGRMVGVLALSLLALFAILVALEILQHDSVEETASSNSTLERLRTLYPMLNRVDDESLPDVVRIASTCHAGYVVTKEPFRAASSSEDIGSLRTTLSRELSLDVTNVRLGHAHLTRDDFSYARCHPTEIDLPIRGIVISLQLRSGRWLNAEVHPHEWHWREKLDWMMRASAAFVFVGGIAILFMRRLSKPLSTLTAAAQHFGTGLRLCEVQEEGPLDVRRAIRSFNRMQWEVTDEVARRMNMLAALSHDIRTPLTALRIKAELIEGPEIRADLISSIHRMEAITASALAFLRGESRNEPMRSIDLSALVETECLDFEDTGGRVTFGGQHNISCICRPDALACAVRNLIDNAIRYGNGAQVCVSAGSHFVDIKVADTGPGIPVEKIALALQPFERLSKAREGHQGGFGLGLAIVQAIVKGHDGEIMFEANVPTGLIATIRLTTPASAAEYS